MRLATFALEACILLLVVGAAAAQDRMPPVPKDKMTEAQKKALEEVIAGLAWSGRSGGAFRSAAPQPGVDEPPAENRRVPSLPQ